MFGFLHQSAKASSFTTATTTNKFDPLSYFSSGVSTTTTTPYTTASLSGYPTIDKDLSIGMKDPEILTLQKILNLNPITQIAQSGPGSPGNETTYFGALTKQAVIRLQVRRGTSLEDGVVNFSTRAALDLQSINEGSKIITPTKSPQVSNSISISTNLNTPVTSLYQKVL